MSLKQASQELGINYSSAKTIMQTLKHKGRIYRKLTRDRMKKSQARPPPTFLPNTSALPTTTEAAYKNQLPELATSLANRSSPGPSTTPQNSPGNSDSGSEGLASTTMPCARFAFAEYSPAIMMACEAHYQERQSRLLTLLGLKTLPLPHDAHDFLGCNLGLSLGINMLSASQ